MFRRSHHLSLFWTRFIESMLSHSVSLRSVVILSSHLHSCLLSGLEAPHFFIFLQPVIIGSHLGVNEMLSFGTLITVWNGSFLLAFQNNLSIPSFICQSRPLKMGLISCREMLVRNYYRVLHKMPKECKSHFSSPLLPPPS